MTIKTHGLKPGATFKYPYRVKDWKSFATTSTRESGGLGDVEYSNEP